MRRIISRINKIFVKRPKTIFLALLVILILVGGVYYIRRPQITVWTDPKPTIKMTYPRVRSSGDIDKTVAPFYKGSAPDVQTDVTLHDVVEPFMLLALVTVPPLGVGVIILDWCGVLSQFTVVDAELYIFNIPVDIEFLDGDRNIKKVTIQFGASPEQKYTFNFQQPGAPSFAVDFDFVIGYELSQFSQYCPEEIWPLCYDGLKKTMYWSATIEDWDGNTASKQFTREIFFAKQDPSWDLRPDMDTEKWKKYGGYYGEDIVGIEDFWIMLPLTLMGLAFYRKRKKKECLN